MEKIQIRVPKDLFILAKEKLKKERGTRYYPSSTDIATACFESYLKEEDEEGVEDEK